MFLPFYLQDAVSKTGAISLQAKKVSYAKQLSCLAVGSLNGLKVASSILLAYDWWLKLLSNNQGEKNFSVRFYIILV